MRTPASGQQSQALPVAAHKCFLFGACPSLHLPFGCNGIGYRLEVLREDQLDRPPPRSVATKQSGVVLSDAKLQSDARRADIVAAVRTQQYVEVRTVIHGPPHPSRRVA